MDVGNGWIYRPIYGASIIWMTYILDSMDDHLPRSLQDPARSQQSWPSHLACPAQAGVGSGNSTRLGWVEAMPKSAGSSPRSLVGSYPLDSLPGSWDGSPSIRDRIRDGHSWMVRLDQKGDTQSGGFIEATSDNLRLNHAVFHPVLKIMAQHDLQLPSIEGLLAAIEAFYVLCKVSRSVDSVYQEAWGIRRGIVRMKKFIYRPVPPQDCLAQTCLYT